MLQSFRYIDGKITNNQPDSAKAFADPQDPERSSLPCLSDGITLIVGAFSISQSLDASWTGVMLLLSGDVIVLLADPALSIKR